MNWISVDKDLPRHDTTVEITYDGGKTVETGKYTDRRVCMMAGIAGGHGYFGEGWAVSDDSGADKNLIIDEPTHWRYPESTNKG